MQALLVFESMFGNTETIARAVAAGLSTSMQVTIVEVGQAAVEVGPEVDLLVIGGPTHAWGMSKPRTRQDAVDRAGRAGGTVVSGGEGIREWLAKVEPTGAVPAVAFTTRMAGRWSGSATRGARKLLKSKGFVLAQEAESFIVKGISGPLVDGESARAYAWGERLAGVRPF